MDDRLLIPVSDLPGPLPAGAPRTTNSYCAYLDLSPPPLDAAGWPTRIDGLDVAAGMLARAMGLDPSQGLTWARNPGEWNLWTLEGQRKFRGDPNHPALPGGIIVPALATIDPTDPLAPRLAMAACFRARVWEGR